MTIYFIIFCDPIMERPVSTDIISRQYFFDRSREIFKKNNFIVKYYYKFLSVEKQKVYTDIYVNFNTSDEQIIKQYDEDCNIILNEIITDDKYNNALIMGCQPIGFDKILKNKIDKKLKMKNIKLLLLMYDPHAFINKYFKDEPLLKEKLFWNIETHNVTDSRLENVDYIISSSVLYFYNVNSKYISKCINTQFSFNENYKNYFTDLIQNNVFTKRNKKYF
jgi:hypothetical protein